MMPQEQGTPHPTNPFQVSSLHAAGAGVLQASGVHFRQVALDPSGLSAQPSRAAYCTPPAWAYVRVGTESRSTSTLKAEHVEHVAHA